MKRRRCGGRFSGLPTLLAAPSNAFDFAPGSSTAIRDARRVVTAISSPHDITGTCQKTLDVRPASGSAAVTRVSIGDARARHNVSFVGGLIRICGQSTGSSGGRITAGATRFVSRHVGVVGNRLKAARRRLRAFGHSTKLASLGDSTRLTLDRGSRCRGGHTRGDARLQLMRFLTNCTGGPSRTCRMLPIGINLASANLTRLVGHCGRVLLRHGHLLHSSRRGGPIMIGLSTDVHTVHDGILAAVGDMRENLTVARTSLRHRTNGCTKHVAGTPKRRHRLIDVSHRRRVGTNLCLVLLRGHRRGTVALTSATGGTHVISRTLTSTVPMSPGKGVVCLMTLVLKVTLPMIIVCVVRLLGCGVRNHTSIRGVASLPVINSMPLSRSGKGRRDVMMRRGRGSLVTRAFHGMHAGMLCVVEDSRGIVLIASAAAKRNGAFVTSGLTIDLTLLKGGVIVIKLSVHGPDLGGTFGLSRERRNVDRFLTGPRRASLVSLMRISHVGTGLSVLPKKPVPPGPARLITHRSLPRTVSVLGGRFSCVVLSATPVNVIASALLVSHMTGTDVCIYQTSCARGTSCALVGRLDRRGGLPGLYALVGKLSVGGGGCKCCCKCNGCNGCCKCNGGCNCNCKCNARGMGGGWFRGWLRGAVELVLF